MPVAVTPRELRTVRMSVLKTTPVVLMVGVLVGTDTTLLLALEVVGAAVVDMASVVVVVEGTTLAPEVDAATDEVFVLASVTLLALPVAVSALEVVGAATVEVVVAGAGRKRGRTQSTNSTTPLVAK